MYNYIYMQPYIKGKTCQQSSRRLIFFHSQLPGLLDESGPVPRPDSVIRSTFSKISWSSFNGIIVVNSG